MNQKGFVRKGHILAIAGGLREEENVSVRLVVYQMRFENWTPRTRVYLSASVYRWYLYTVRCLRSTAWKFSSL
jgi:hypothetical protein